MFKCPVFERLAGGRRAGEDDPRGGMRGVRAGGERGGHEVWPVDVDAEVSRVGSPFRAVASSRARLPNPCYTLL